mgnify:CR=1 FL=1
MNAYRIAPRVYVEMFEEDAVLLVADQDVMVTVDHSAVHLFNLALEAFGSRVFSRSECVDLLLQHFEMTVSEAQKKVSTLIAFGVMFDLVLKKKIVADPD